MIHSYSLKNFYSVGEQVNVNFTVGDQAPKTTCYVESAGDRLSLVEAVVGPNASGKTNLIKGLAFLRHLIGYSYNTDPQSDIPIVPFMNSSSPTELSVIFSVSNRLFSYAFSLNSQRILKEVLKEQSLTGTRRTFKTLFNREWDSTNKGYEITNNLAEVTSMKLRRNASVVATAYLENDDEIDTVSMIANYWRDGVATNVYEKGHWGDKDLIHRPTAERQIEFFFKDAALREKVKNILMSYDLGFSDFIKEKSQIDDSVNYGIEHKYRNKSFSVPLDYESSGTLRMLTVLRVALSALAQKGGIAAIDELDAYLHPDIIEAIVSLFSSSEINKNNTQLIFSTHNHRMLNDFDKQQIILVEKDAKGNTESWRLDDVKGVRSDDNYYTKYIAGSYGAIPKIDT